ncbi:MAG: hypothetical protein LRY54_01865 [Alphaproteobacteria bacterium]|nr:hypothetical protein [Alphaproteobacteria bacterium]
MTTNPITALKAVFTTQEFYPENLSDRQVEILQSISDFLDWLEALPATDSFLSADLSRQAQTLINQAALSGLHAYAHHAVITTPFSIRQRPGKAWAIALEAVDIPRTSANQRA